VVDQPVCLVRGEDPAVSDPAPACPGRVLLEDPAIQTPPVEALRDPGGEKPARAIVSEDLICVG